MGQLWKNRGSTFPKNPSNISNRDSNPGQLDNLCQLEETDDEDLNTPIVENKPLTVAKITQV